MKRLFITAIVALAAFCANAQSFDRWRFNTEYDYSRTSKSDLTCSFATDFRNEDGHGFTLGYKVGSERHFINLAYQIALFDNSKGGTFYIENRYLYRYFSGYKMQEFNAMLNAGYRNIHWDFKFGLCNRYIAEVPLRKNGGQGTVFEPMNVVFDIEYNLFPQDHEWNVGAGVSNYREFIIERVTLFYYTLHGYYDIDKHWRLLGETGLHPAGVLNLSAQYNGFFMNFGFTYNY